MSSSMLVKDVFGRVDYGIITIREDEFNAVLDRLPTRSTVTGGKQFYEFGRAPVDGGGERGVAVTRCQSQGQAVAQSVTGHMIRDLEPRVLLLVGIAGGVPSDDFSLGDVLLASRVHDFSVSAALQGGMSQLNVGGGPVHRIVEKLLAHLQALLRRMPNWNTLQSVGCPSPGVTIPADLNAAEVYGPDDWKRKVIDSLRRHFPTEGQRRPPLAAVGPTASSNQLVKDANLVLQWQEAARSFTNIEMELAGVLQAARDADGGEVPVIAIRGLSDIVGFRRHPDWTGYACHSAASLCLAMIKSRVIEEATDWDWDAPGLMHGKVTTVNEWLAGVMSARPPEETRPSAVPASEGDAANTPAPASRILILGSGGVGKTTLGAFLSGKEDRSPFAAPPAYNESVTIERYALNEVGGPEAMILVPPGQPHRRVANWEELYNSLCEGHFHGIIFLVAYGYHSVGQARWNELPLAKTLKRKTLTAFMKVYLERQREEELNVLKEMSSHIRACKTKLWLMTLVGKEDLWYPDRTKVEEHYRTGAYGTLICKLEQAKGSKLFKHELVLASLVIHNFTSSVGETLARNQAGYDRVLQVKSLRRLVEVFDSLRRWERGE
jgi:nucleoside phosphorylase